MSAELDKLSDRHFRPDPQGVLAARDAGRRGRVCIHVDAEMGGSVGGQHLAWMLVNLLCRQFGVVEEILLDVAPVNLHRGVAPFGAHQALAETLAECVRLVSGHHIGVNLWRSACRSDVHLLVGSSFTEPMPGRTWRLYGDGWRYYVGVSGSHPRTAPSSSLSIGPYLAACHASAEVFKLFRGMKPGKGAHIEEFFASAWTMSTASSWSELAEAPCCDTSPGLPHFYFAGAGAVAQAAALCLGSSGLSGSCTAVDRDTLDLTNDNRYVLSHKGHEGASKVAHLGAYLEASGITCNPRDNWWEQHVGLAGRHAANGAIGALERQYRYPLVLSCVDENEPRHALQNALPRLIVGGSTDGLTAKATTYYLGGRYACLKCHNPVRQRNQVVRARLDAARSMTIEQQTVFCAEIGITLEELRRLLEAAGCGQLGQRDIERFAAPSPQMSVGFVSAAAGTLLTAQLLRLVALGVGASSAAGSSSVATFARAGLRRITIGPDTACDCEAVLRPRWSRLWQDTPL